MNIGDKIEFNWPELGKLKIRLNDNLTATIRFEPSEKASNELLKKASNKPSKPLKCK